MKINGETQIIGFFGSTFKTSKMYALYNAAFKELKLNYVYIPFVVSDLKKAVEGIRSLGIKGVGVTIPYKIEIIKYLDQLDENARRIGAVNTVINQAGKLVGFNTDGLGAAAALKEKLKELRDKKILILGAGGASKSIRIALSDEGAKVTVLSREKMKYLTTEINNASVLINATPVGMYPDTDSSLVPIHSLTPKLAVMDIVTNPRETRLLRDAKAAGCEIIYGERMLLYQAILKFKIFTGIDAPIKVMEDALC